ncbi:MAG: hypothetical protein A2809_03235 [Candidatus Muproteobacteria bacterium RIFCSPHIGHO2_01_FULL_61_200]|nr:MAG: hypothetical protein A2809_03235 [Candidatus Muproteobacteria bacterium RIFCSPHIGHO2_01_FULL_61_200]
MVILLYPALRNAGFKPWQLFGLLSEDGRDDPSSPTGFITLGRGRSVTPEPLLCTMFIDIQGRG